MSSAVCSRVCYRSRYEEFEICLKLAADVSCHKTKSSCGHTCTDVGSRNTRTGRHQRKRPTTGKSARPKHAALRFHELALREHTQSPARTQSYYLLLDGSATTSGSSTITVLARPERSCSRWAPFSCPVCSLILLSRGHCCRVALRRDSSARPVLERISRGHLLVTARLCLRSLLRRQKTCSTDSDSKSWGRDLLERAAIFLSIGKNRGLRCGHTTQQDARPSLPFIVPFIE